MNLTEKVPSKCKQKFQKKAFNFSDKTNHKNLFLLEFFIWSSWFPIDIFVNGKIEIHLKSYLVVKLPVGESLNNFRAMVSLLTLIHEEPWHLLDTLASQCIRISSTFCAFPAREKVETSSINAHTCLFSWLIFAKHGLFGIQLTAYSARSRLTDHGIYYIIDNRPPIGGRT